MADFYGSSYCLNVVVTRLGTESRIPKPAETYMGAEIFPWHVAANDGVAFISGKTTNAVRVAYFCDGHAKIASELAISQQCVPNPAVPTDTGFVLVP